MKNQLNYLFILLFVSLGCQKDPVDQRMDGCVGVSFYYLDNQSSRPLSVEFVGPRLNDQIDPNTIINAQQRVLIGQDASFGYSPRPADTFSSVTLYALVDSRKSAVYTQVPVQTALWTRKKQNPGDPEVGCQQVEYVLTITDASLK